MATRRRKDSEYTELVPLTASSPAASPADTDPIRQALNHDLQLEAITRRRLERLQWWRGQNEPPYPTGRRLRSLDISNESMEVVDAAHKLLPDYREQIEEIKFILQHFDDPKCTQFKPVPHYVPPEAAVCSVCGLTNEFHELEEETDDVDGHLASDWRRPSDVTDSGATAAAYVQTHGLDSLTESETKDRQRLPAMTFGSVYIPRRFVRHSNVDGCRSISRGLLRRKYLRFNCECTKEGMTFLWQLLTSKWKLKLPSLVLSVTGGPIAQMNKYARRSMTAAISKLVCHSDVWLLSDGRNYGASRFLGQLINKEFDKFEAKENEDSHSRHQATDPVKIGISHWGSIRRKKFLCSINEPPYGDGSRYFYSLEYRLARDEHSRILNPHQTAYLLLDNGKQEPEDCVQKFRENFDHFLKHDAANNIALPVVTLVLGGDPQKTINRVAQAVKDQRPVVVFKGSSRVPTLLAELFYVLEDKVQRTWRDKLTWDERETRMFQSYVDKFSDNIRDIFGISLTKGL